MEFKYLSWSAVGICLILNIFGIFWCITILFSISTFIIGFLTIIYLQHGNIDVFLGKNKIDNPLEDHHHKVLGLNLACDQKPILLISPNVKIQTESKKRKILLENSRKKSLIDSGIELLFKKNIIKNIKDGSTTTSSIGHRKSSLGNRSDIGLDTQDNVSFGSGSNSGGGGGGVSDEKRWKPFETIKIYTERRRSHDKGDSKGDSHLTDELSNSNFKLHTDSAILDGHGSPKHKKKAMLSGNKQIDQLLHTIIDYILRDYIDSWFCSLSDNKEFSEFRTRNCIEECVQNICTRIKSIQWIPLLTTKLIDNIAAHSKLYRIANQSINMEHSKESNSKLLSPQRKTNQNQNNKKSQQQHRRNKSDTDLSWYLRSGATQKNVANSKFYTDKIDEQSLTDPESKLLNTFFNNCNLYKNECLDERALENYLTHIMETVLYFTLPEEDFACLPLRTFLSTLIANVVFKPLLDMLSEPDFINLQVARLISKEPPSSDFFLKLIRQCSDLSELRACRQLLTKEMDTKFKDSNSNAELTSLKYTQKLIDLRISYLQNNKSELNKYEKDKPISNLPILTLDELLTKELALSYYLDYLSILNLQKYVIFYLTAQEWKLTTNRSLIELQSNKMKISREETLKTIRDKGFNIYIEYLMQSSPNYLNIDHGLIEALHIKLKDSFISPEGTWFDSICKFIYEKIKNEDVLLNNFYQSSAYKKLLLELEFLGQNNEPLLELDTNSVQLHATFDTGSDSNSGDLLFDEDDQIVLDDEIDSTKKSRMKLPPPSIALPTTTVKVPSTEDKTNIIGATYDLTMLPILNTKNNIEHKSSLLEIGNFKHSRSHSDCTGLMTENDMNMIKSTFQLNTNRSDNKELVSGPSELDTVQHVDTTKPVHNLFDSKSVTSSQSKSINSFNSNHSNSNNHNYNISSGNYNEIKQSKEIQYTQRISAKIINTAIHCEGQYAVYAIHVQVIEDNQEKSWHIYRRYSKFLELKKILVKKYPTLSKVPFPAKKTFHNTQRSVLEHRMLVLNEFLHTICLRAEDIEDISIILREFLEPDTNDKRIHGGAVIRTIETLVHPFKSGMKTIKNMPDNLVGGIAKILLGRPTKESSFLDVTPIHLEQSSEYPALTSALNLLDEVFDLQARSQWLRRGIINRLLGAPWVSHTANKRIIHAVKSLIEIDKIEQLLTGVLNGIWPDGRHPQRTIPREDNTKLRTRMAAKIALFALLSDDLKHVVGSETTRYGLLNCFSMWQHKKLNLRLVLILFNDILTTLYHTDDLTKHIKY